MLYDDTKASALSHLFIDIYLGREEHTGDDTIYGAGNA